METAGWLDMGQLGNVLSSSTSVVKRGNCGDDNFRSRWSAFGAGPGEIVMISSAKDTTTTAPEMCQVFQAFDIQNAIRMDGGPSASMMITNELTNPLTLWNYTKYGPMRYLAYGVRMAWVP